MLFVPPAPTSILSRSLGVDVADVFSTDLYTGNSSTQSITNGVDLSGEGGMVWLKGRSARNHHLFDTERGAGKILISNQTGAEYTVATTLSSFESDGYDLGSNSETNFSAETFVGWSFRKASGFFDVVTYSGNSTNRTIAHNLGSEPGMVIVKSTTNSESWNVYHRANTGEPETDYLTLNSTSATNDNAAFWNDTAPTDSVFSLGTEAGVNFTGRDYVAYLFAHDPDGIIQCGSYTGNGSSSGPSINLGWEAQFIMFKRASGGTADWAVFDSGRGNEALLKLNTSESEVSSTSAISFVATGVDITSTNSRWNASGSDYIYMAIKAED